ncbi:MAG: MerR family transcriptional regulator [Nitrospirae bacterium]|nr:MerR family transcriptional regulator [Nitrospirota bacterium]
MDKKTYGPKEICKLANISARQLGYWKLIGVVRPRQELHGSKIFHRYTEWDLDLLKAVQKLTEEGYRVSKAADKIKAALARGEHVSVQELLGLAGLQPASLQDPSQTVAPGMETFRQRVQEELIRSRRFRYPLSCLAIRVEVSPPDNEDVMRRVSLEVEQKLIACKRAYDVMAQVDRLEFVWLLCQTAGSGAQLVIIRVQKILSDLEWVIGETRYSIRTRIRSAALQSADKDGMKMVEAARAALNTGI